MGDITNIGLYEQYPNPELDGTEVTHSQKLSDGESYGDTLDQRREYILTSKEIPFNETKSFSVSGFSKVSQTTDINIDLNPTQSVSFGTQIDYIDGNGVNNITINPSISFDGSLDNTQRNIITYIYNENAGNNVYDRTIVSVLNRPLPAPTTVPTITSIVITDSNPDELQVTFNVAPTAGDTTGLTLDGDFSDATITGIVSQVSNVWVFSIDRDAVGGESGNLVYVGSTIENSGEFLQDGSTAITNNVDIPEPNPVYQSSEIGNVADNILTISVDVNSDFTWLGTPEIILTASGGAVTVTSAVGTTNALTGQYNLSRSIANGETVTIEVLAANGIGNTLDFSKKMGAVSAGTSVTNNVEAPATEVTAGMTNKYLFESNLNDSSGNSNTGTAFGTTSYDTIGPIEGTASLVVGDDGGVDLPNTLTSDYTKIIAFTLPDVTDQPRNLFSTNASVGNLFYITTQNSIYQVVASHGFITQATSDFALSANTLYFVGLTYDSVAQELQIFNAGLPVGTTGTSVATALGEGLQVGNLNSSVNNGLNGTCDYVKLYNRVLSDAEMLQEYNYFLTQVNP